MSPLNQESFLSVHHSKIETEELRRTAINPHDVSGVHFHRSASSPPPTRRPNDPAQGRGAPNGGGAHGLPMWNGARVWVTQSFSGALVSQQSSCEFVIHFTTTRKARHEIDLPPLIGRMLSAEARAHALPDGPPAEEDEEQPEPERAQRHCTEAGGGRQTSRGRARARRESRACRQYLIVI